MEARSRDGTKIVCTTEWGMEHLQTLQRRFPILHCTGALTLAEQRAGLLDADATIGWPQRETLPVARRLRWVHALSAGIEELALLPELVERDEVVITNSRGVQASAVADHCFAFMLAFARCIRELEEDRRQRRWDYTGRPPAMAELSGCSTSATSAPAIEAGGAILQCYNPSSGRGAAEK